MSPINVVQSIIFLSVSIGIMCFGVYLCFIGQTEKTKENKNLQLATTDSNESFSINDMTIENEVDKMISDLSWKFDEYILDLCLDRAKHFNRKKVDMADFNGVILELGCENKIINELMKRVNTNDR